MIGKTSIVRILSIIIIILWSLFFLFVSGVGFPLFPEIFYFIYTMILQRSRIIVGDAGFEPVTLSII